MTLAVRRPLFLFVAVLLFSQVFWVQDSVSFVGWSIFEAAAALLLGSVWAGGNFRMPERRAFLPFLLLALWSSASALWSSNFHATLTGSYKILAALAFTVVLLNDREDWEAVFPDALAWTGLAASCLWLVWHTGDWMQHPNFYAGLCALSGVLWTERFLSRAGRERLGPGAAALAVLGALFTINSLGPILAWAAGAGFLAARRSRRVFLLSVVLVPAALLAATLVLSHATDRWILGNVIERKIKDPFSGERISIWKDSWTMFRAHPAAGTGLGTYREHYPQYKTLPGLRLAPYAHSEPLNLACELGLIGLGLALWAAALAGGFILRKVREREDETWTAVALAMLVHSLFDFNLHISAWGCSVAASPARRDMSSCPIVNSA